MKCQHWTSADHHISRSGMSRKTPRSLKNHLSWCRALQYRGWDGGDGSLAGNSFSGNSGAMQIRSFIFGDLLLFEFQHLWSSPTRGWENLISWNLSHKSGYEPNVMSIPLLGSRYEAIEIEAQVTPGDNAQDLSTTAQSKRVMLLSSEGCPTKF